jgi:hypothetical protein
MKKYDLLFQQENKEATERLKKLMSDHVQTHDQPQVSIGSWTLASGDDFPAIRECIQSVYADAAFIILIDNPKDLCYIYKAKGNIKKIKETILKDALVIHKRIYKTDVFFSEIIDLRGIPLDIHAN